MKAVIHNYDDAVKFVHRVFDRLGETFERPQLIRCVDYKPPRTLPQNAKFHAMLGDLADHVGYSISELKDWFKQEYGPKKEFTYDGHTSMIPKSTAEYSKIEMIEMIGQVERIAAEMGYQFDDERM